MRLFILIFSLSLFGPASGAASTETDLCDVALVADRTLARMRGDAGRVQRLVLKTLDRSLKAKVFAECGVPSRCSEADVRRILESSVAEFNKRSKTYRAYGVILGTWAAGMGMTIYLNTIPAVQPYAPVTGVIMGAVGMWTISPIWGPISHDVTSWFNRLTGRGANADISQHSDKEMKEHYLRTQATTGPLAQIAGQRFNQYLQSLGLALSETRARLKDGDELGAADELAEFLMRARKIFPEVEADHQLVRWRVQTSGLSRQKSAGPFYDLVLARIAMFDPAARDEDVFSYYKTLLDTWRKLDQ